MKGKVKLIYKGGAPRPYVIIVNGVSVFECGQNVYAWKMIRQTLEYLGVQNPVRPDFVK